MHSAIHDSTWDVLCIQETGWEAEHVRRVEEMREGELHCALGSVHSRSVAVLVKPGILGESSLFYADTCGRFIVLDFVRGSTKIRLINIHAPNDSGERKRFFLNIFSYVNHHTILIGDFNVALSKLDLGPNNTYVNDVSRSYLLEAAVNADLSEIWRGFHRQFRGYSQRQVVQGVLLQSRIDLCFASSTFWKYISGATYTWAGWSDHSHLSVSLEIPAL